MKDHAEDEKKRENALPRITTKSTWHTFDDDMLAHLEASGLDEGWASDDAPLDTEPDFYPAAGNATEIVDEVVPVAAYRNLVTGLTARHNVD